MDTIPSDLMATVNSAVDLKLQNQTGAATMSLLKKSLETDKMLGQEIAQMLEVGTKVDLSA